MLNATNNPMLSIGAFVEALAPHVTNLAESARRYGSPAKSKIVSGIVVKSCQERMQSATNAGRMSTLIVADYVLGGSTFKRSVLNIRSVRSVERSEWHAELENAQRLTSEEGLQPLLRVLEDDFRVPTVPPTPQQSEEDKGRNEAAEDACFCSSSSCCCCSYVGLRTYSRPQYRLGS